MQHTATNWSKCIKGIALSLLLLCFGFSAIKAQNCTASFMFTLNGLSVSFMDMSTTSGSPIVSWQWDFDDGATSVQANPTHVFPEADKYKVCLTIQTANGCQNEVCIDVEICQLNISANVNPNCNAAGQISVAVTISDVYDSAKNITVSLDGQLVAGSPFNIDDVAPVVINLTIPGDGLTHSLTAISEDVAGCTQTVTFAAPDCFSDCFLSGVNANITGGTVHSVTVDDNFFSPQTVTVTVGDVVRFTWIGSGHTTTSDATTGPDAWNSGLLNAGSVYDVLIKNPGTHRYYCIPHGGPGGAGMAGIIVANCPAGGIFPVQVSFNTSVAGSAGYQILINGIPTPASPYPYSGTGANNTIINIAGNGLPHTITVQDVADPTCQPEKTFNAPDCGAAPPCSVTLSATLAGACAGLNAPYLLSVNAINGSSSFTVWIDGLQSGSPILYNPTGATSATINLPGDGAAHTIEIRDAANPATCNAAVSVTTPNCALPCSIANLSVSTGTAVTHIVQVQDFQFAPQNITVTVGDTVRFVWTGVVQHTTTSDATSGPLVWNSGLHGNGFVFDVVIAAPGVHGYYCVPHGAPGGIGMAGSITALPACNEGLATVQLSFAATNGSAQGFGVWLDGNQLTDAPIPYALSGNNAASVNITGDGLLHTLTVRDWVNVGCAATVSLTAPDCGFTLPCSLNAMASVVSGCNDNQQVEVMIHTEAQNMGAGFTATIDGVPLSGSPFAYGTMGMNMLTAMVNGNGGAHTFVAQDTSYPDCTATATFTTPNCALPCSIANLSVSTGTAVTHIVQVQDFQFAPQNITVTVGDTVRFVWTGVVQHTTTSDATSGPLVWNSGLHGNGFVFDVVIAAPGVHGYYCVPHGAPGGIGMAGSITALPACNEGLATVQLSFAATNGSAQGFGVWLDGNQLTDAPIPYALSGNNAASVNITGDGLLHTLTVRDWVNVGCAESVDLLLPDCGVEPACLLTATAQQTSGCNTQNQISVELTITSVNAGTQGFNVLVDNIPVSGSPFVYNASGSTIINIPVTGTGNMRTISVQDVMLNTCSASVSINTPLCGEFCQIENLQAVSGQPVVHIVEVRDYDFYPPHIKAVEGDTIRFVWTGVIQHTSTSDALSGLGAWNSGLLGQGAVYDVVLTQLGLHPYYCIPHGGPGGIGMAGVVEVLPACVGETAAVSVSFSVTNGSPNGYKVFINGALTSGSPFTYVNPVGQNNVIIYAPGNGNQQIITVQDQETPICAASAVVTTALCGAGCVILGLTAATGGSINHIVEVRDFDFFPPVLNITLGETVTFVWTGAIPHTSTSDVLSGPNAWNSGLLTQGDTYTLTLTEAGAHPYYCIPHGGPGGVGMAGVINVLPNCTDNVVPVQIGFSVSNGSASGYRVFVDGVLLPDSPFMYQNPVGANNTTLSITGDGATHAITVQDLANPICAATTFIQTPDCTPECSISNYSVTVAGQPVNHVVEVRDFVFAPDNLQITLGDTVTFVWTGVFPHTSTSDAVTGADVWNSGLLTQGAVYQVVITTVGEHGYYCVPHGAPGGIGMAGSITVLPPCNENGQVAVGLQFLSTNGSSQGYNIYTNNVLLPGSPYTYSASGVTNLSIWLNGDGNTINISVADAVQADCLAEVSVLLPDCNPQAPCTAAISYVAQGLSFSFYDISATAQPVQTWEWTFGDGATANGIANPVHVYPSAGTYTVCLQITAAPDCVASVCTEVQVADACTDFEANFTVTPIGQLFYQFTDATTGLGILPDSWLWGFGDGAISFEQNPAHQYSQAGNYMVCLIAQQTAYNCLNTYCREITVTGMEENILPDWRMPLNVYPNPVSKHLFSVQGLHPTDIGKPVSVKLYDISGKIMLNMPTMGEHLLSLNMPDAVANGWYLLELKTEQFTYKTALIVLR